MCWEGEFDWLKEFERLESEVKEMCKSNVYKKDVTRKKIQKAHYDKTPEDTTPATLDGNDGRQSFIGENYYIALDSLLFNLNKMKSIYSEIYDKSVFL